MRYHRGLLALIPLLLLASHAQGYRVGYGLSLDQLSAQSDLVAKVEAISSEVVADPEFKPIPGFAVFATRLKLISVLKGDATLGDITFHHYDTDPDRRGHMMYELTFHHLKPADCYILFARMTDEPTVFRTFTGAPTMAAHKELIRTGNSDPLPRDITIKDAIWRELKALLAGNDTSNVLYAISELDKLSAPGFVSQKAFDDFPRHDVLDLISPFLANEDPKIAGAALGAIGRASPYLGQNLGWLATVGKGDAFRRGHGTYPPGYANHSARECREQLLSLANSPASPELRGTAIRSVGLSRENEADDALLVPLRVWSKDPAAPVRAAAAVLWADYPSQEATASVQSLARDQVPLVRASAAFSIGCAQVSELVDEMDIMLDDSDAVASGAAAISLLSFDTKVAGPILKAHSADPRYHVAFINALADADPAPYRDDLVAIITAEKTGPEMTLTGQVPRYTAWDVLMKYISRCDPAEIRAGKLDKYLDALETPPNIGSGPYQTLYRFYHEMHLTDRMQSFRQKALKQVTYDLDIYFKQIDNRP